MLSKILNLFKKKEEPIAVIKDEVKIEMNPPVPFPTVHPAEPVAAPAKPKAQKQAAKPKAAPAPAAKKTVKAKK
jgi:hypothetical protein